MSDDSRAALENLLAELRPRLHRYCARMTGSTVDGEDVVQDAMIKALHAWDQVRPVDNPTGWIFRIAHNTALDLLRCRSREPATQPAEDLEMIVADDVPDDAQEVALLSLRTFLRLPALQRSAVILKDVLGHSIEEVSSITGASPAAAKSALQRGRTRLRELSTEPEDIDLPQLSAQVQARLVAYVTGFRTGDFDAVRQMLADDVKLDLAGKMMMQGKSTVREYYTRYAEAAHRWAYGIGVVEGRPAMLVFERAVSLETPAYFVALTFVDDRVTVIHDFLFARYALEGVELVSGESGENAVAAE
jgi:RNA polymerase sigma-70 factor (ECF subfamily)